MITVDTDRISTKYKDWSCVLGRIEDTKHSSIRIGVNSTNGVTVDMFTNKVTVIKPVVKVKDPRKKGVQSLLDFCKHCHEMTYLIIGFKPLIHCIHCSKEVW